MEAIAWGMIVIGTVSMVLSWVYGNASKGHVEIKREEHPITGNKLIDEYWWREIFDYWEGVK